MNDAPCKGCADRHVGCHSGCEKYKKFREPFDAAMRERDRLREADSLHHDSRLKGYKTYKRKRDYR